MCPDWTIRWETVSSGFQRREVLTAPDGAEWLWSSPEAARAYILPRTRGLQPAPIRPRQRREV